MTGVMINANLKRQTYWESHQLMMTGQERGKGQKT
jgi:hypothetical protein